LETTNLFGTDQLWLYLDQIGILIGFAGLLITVILAFVGFYKRYDIRNWFSGNKFPETGVEVKDTKVWDTVIFTVSRPSTPKWVIDTVAPERIGFIGSVNNQVFKDSLNEVKEYGVSKGCNVMAAQVIQDVSDVSEIKAKVKILIEDAKKNGAQNIAVDLTGGTAPMSLAAFMAAEECTLTSLYVSMDFKEFKPIYSSAKLIKISQHESK